MRLIPANTGSYPRIGEAPDAQRHRRAYARRERGELSEAEWQAVEDEVTGEVIAEQLAAGVELPTDGQVRWYDPVSHLARPLANVTINGLLRYFDTNFYFRQPVVSGPIAGRLRSCREFERPARRPGPARSSRCSPGPTAWPRGSILEGGYRTPGWPRRTRRSSPRRSPTCGSRGDLIQIDEPYPLQHPEDVERGAAGSPRWRPPRGAPSPATPTSGRAPPLRRSQASRSTSSGSTSPSPSWRCRIAEAGSARSLGLGLVDGQHQAGNARDGLPGARPGAGAARGTAYLGPSCGLEFLPRSAGPRDRG
jgi:hypothetical protein